MKSKREREQRREKGTRKLNKEWGRRKAKRKKII